MMEQKPSSRKVSMKVRRIGPHRMQSTAREVNRFQHLWLRRHSQRRKSETRRKRESRSQVRINTPELSSSLTDS